VFDTVLDAPDVADMRVVWDGRGPDGKVLPGGRHVTVRVSLVEVGEVHFTLRDVEGLEGGLSVETLAGAGVGSYGLFWDDTALGEDCVNQAGVSVGCASKPGLRKADGVDSRGGVHGWDAATAPQASWGNRRLVDSWVTTRVDAKSVAGLPGRVLGVRNDRASTSSGVPVAIEVLANDENPTLDDAGGDGPPRVELIEGGCGDAMGSWEVDADRRVVFTPYEGFHGTAACAYVVTRSDGDTGLGTIVVEVANNLSVVPDMGATSSGKRVDVDVLANDGYVDTGARVTLSGTDPRQGTWTAFGYDGTVVFVPADGFHGTASATYTVTEPDGTTATGTVSVVVANRVVARDDRARLVAGDSVTVLVWANDSYLDSRYRVVVAPGRGRGSWRVTGDGSVVFTPRKGFTGTATATYTITEPDGTTSSATITIDVAPAGDGDGGGKHPTGDHQQPPDGTDGDGTGGLPGLGGPPLALAALGLLLVGAGSADLARQRQRRQRRPATAGSHKSHRDNGGGNNSSDDDSATDNDSSADSNDMDDSSSSDANAQEGS
jgi:hypothetical protein